MAEQSRAMRYISLFSGIEAASLAWGDLGLEPVAFSEIEPFPCAVLAHRFPEVSNLGDITKVDWSDYADKGIDIIVGGSPCQSFSVAGKREGLAGASGLMFEYIRAVQEVMPRWIVWENVPGALSSENGAAFGQLLGELDALGYGLAWRVLDAQFFGVAQRRQRLFLVGSLGDGGTERACEVLFEPDCLQGDLASSREKRKELAARAARGAGAPGGGGCLTIHQNQVGDVHITHDLTGTLTADSSVSRQQLVFGEEPEGGADEARTAIPINTMIATRGGKLGRGTGFGVAEDGDPAYTITATHPHAVCAGFGYKVSPGADSIGYRDEQAPTLLAGRCDASVLIKADPEPTYCIQGSMIGRTDENGPQGSGINEDVSFTLNTVDRHAVMGDGWMPETVGALCASDQKGVSNQLVSVGKVIATEADPEPTVTAFAIDRATTPKFSEELCHTLRRGGAGGCNDAAAVISQYGDIAGTLTARYDSSPCPDRGQNIVGNRSVVRRLTPRECERLQGMPDNWTRVPYRGKTADQCPDGPRYKAIGNSMAVPVMRWIGEGIVLVEAAGDGQ